MKRELNQYHIVLLDETTSTENTSRSTNLTQYIDIYVKAHTRVYGNVDINSVFYNERKFVVATL